MTGDAIPVPDGSTPLDVAREWLRARSEEGTACPLCTQFVKVYRRQITSAVARVLVAMYWQGGGYAGRTDWIDVPALAATLKVSRGRSTGGDEAKARYWGLIEAMPDVRRDDGSTRTGWWALTELGLRFVRGEVTIPQYARVFDGRLLGEPFGPARTIRDCLGKRFDYDELMGRDQGLLA